MSHCTLGENTAEACTIYAQKECAEGDGGYVTRVEWRTVSEAFCNDCDGSACAPNWWTLDQRQSTTDSSGTTTAPSAPANTGN